MGQVLFGQQSLKSNTMAKKGRKQARDSTKAEEPAPVDAADNNADDKASATNENGDGDAGTSKRASKRGSTSAKEDPPTKDDPPAKKKKGKLEENGVGVGSGTRPKRATANKAAKEVKALLTAKKKSSGKKTKKAATPKKPSQFEVESILDTRVRKGKTEYKIRWKGYTSSSDTWEPERNLKNCPEILDAYKADKEKTKAE